MNSPGNGPTNLLVTLLIALLLASTPITTLSQTTPDGPRFIAKKNPITPTTHTQRWDPSLAQHFPKEEVEIVELENLQDLVILKIKQHRPTGAKTNHDLLKKLKKSGLFSQIETDHLITLKNEPPDKAYLQNQTWALRNPKNPNISTNPKETWGKTLGANVTVGVIDTGILTTHEDLKHCLWENPKEIPDNGLDDDQNGYIDDVHGINAITGSGNPTDDHGHGTHVAGTIAAQWGEGPHAGLAPQTKIMALKFLNASGSGWLSDALECLNYAISQKVPILNNSWGGGRHSQILSDAIDSYEGLFIAAAGNAGQNTDTSPMYPACYPAAHVLSVGAHNQTGRLSEFSNFGTHSVDLVAPGENIFSCTAQSNQSYASWDGTSMAAPHATAAAALLLAQNPTLQPLELKNRLVAGTTKLPALRNTCKAGGILNISQSMLLKKTGTPKLELFLPNPLIQGRDSTLEASLSDLAPINNSIILAFQSSPKTGGVWRELNDQGLPPDRKANDGTYSGSWTPHGKSPIQTLFLLAAPPGKPILTQTHRLPVVFPPANDHFKNARPLKTKQTASTLYASREPNEPTHPATSGNHTLWWKWTPKNSGLYTIHTQGSQFDTTLALYQGHSLETLHHVDSNDDARSGLHSEIEIQAEAKKTYHIQISGFETARGQVQLSIHREP